MIMITLFNRQDFVGTLAVVTITWMEFFVKESYLSIL
jgi:hypothetical protein